ncbi:MAG: hypothetical protein GF334_02690 [Candidatus Altiarchaeales archaeon]|nr:hypothetical protein [Candidatus Altiarchaeales archaeon]
MRIREIICLLALSLTVQASLSVSVTPTDSNSYPGFSEVYDLSVENNYEVPITLDFTITGLQEGFSSAVIYTQRALNPGETQTFRVVLTSNREVGFGQRQLSIDVIAKNYFTDEVAGSTSVNLGLDVEDPTPNWCHGADINHDTQVSQADQNQLSLYWGNECSAPSWCDNADVNQDGFVGADDLDVIRSLWGTTGCHGECMEYVDANQNGDFESCECIDCNGCLCDIDDDGAADGVCVDTSCITSGVVSLDCGPGGCQPEDKTSEARIGCTKDGFTESGWACKTDFTSFENNYFNQEGVCVKNKERGEVICATPGEYDHIYRYDDMMGELIADGCNNWCFDPPCFCDPVLDDGNFNPTAVCEGSSCTGTIPDVRVNADFSADSSCERAGGCQSNCNGCLCSIDGDDIPEGICSGDVCVNYPPAALDCGDECTIDDVLNPAFDSCEGNDGLACLRDVWSLWRGYAFFPQDGLCAEDNCIYTEVSRDRSGNLKEECDYADHGQPCDASFNGNFNENYGACNCAACLSNECVDELVDFSQDHCPEICGCQAGAGNGLGCDIEQDLVLDGLCVQDECLAGTISCKVLDNGRCRPFEKIMQGCSDDTGWACSVDVEGDSIFSQEGLCAQTEGTPECVTNSMADHVCRRGNTYYDSCLDCGDGSPCDDTLDDGNFNPTDKMCQGAACVEYVLPDQFDLRNAEISGVTGNWMTPVKNQGSAGTCSIFALIGTLEGRNKVINLNPEEDVDLSEQFMVSCPLESTTDDECFPYSSTSGGDPPCSDRCGDWENRLWTYDNWAVAVGEEEVKKALMSSGPIDVSMHASNMVKDPATGIYSCPNNQINHGVVLVGWNDIEGYYLIKNSWGTAYGDAGYFKIAYGSCSLDWSGVFAEKVEGP